MRVDSMPLNFTQALSDFLTSRDNQGQQYIVNFLWCLWKARNAEVMEGIKVNPMKVCPGHEVLIVDASWDMSGKAGAGIMRYDAMGKLVQMTYYPYEAGDPLHAEALTILRAMQQCQVGTYRRRGSDIFTDCQMLIKELQNTN
jgi:succinyl-CoA synthetase beta subunit